MIKQVVGRVPTQSYYKWLLFKAITCPVLHHCVVIFFWSSGIMKCTCMLFTFENRVPLMR